MTQTTDLRNQLRGAIKTRAMVYAAFFEELSREVGAARAEEILKRAIYRRGEAVGERFKPFAPRDFEGLAAAFIDFVPDHGAMFAPEVTRCDADALDIQFHDCPLKQAWTEAGYSPEQVATLCRIAGIVDAGTFEGAGFRFEGSTWTPGQPGCCLLRIRPKGP